MSNVIELPDGFQPLPSYADPRRALQEVLPSLRPAEQITVTEAAERSMRVNVAGQWQPFRRDVTPYMVEPTDMAATRDYTGLVFCGPSQSGKTQFLQSVSAYCITADPARIALFQMNRDKATEFETDKLAPMLRHSPELRARLAKGVGANRIHQKLFVGGTHLTLNWPTIEQLSSATIRFIMGTDVDRFGKRGGIGGEGDWFSLAKNRPRTYRSRGMVIGESSPGAPIVDETWSPKSPHEAPPVEYGVLLWYNDGTRARLYWPCPQCGEMFEPHYRLLDYPDTADPAEAGQAAKMVAPCCGFPFGHALKHELNVECQWLHEAAPREDENGKLVIDTVPLSSGRVRATDTLSYWMNGAAAAFSTWSELVETHVKADQRFDQVQDEQALIASFNTNRGEPMVRRLVVGDNELTLAALKAKAIKVDMPKAVAPPWTRYIIVWVDTQKTYFAVGAIAFGQNGEHQVIDRFDLHTPPPDAPNAEGRVIDPFNRAEDWAVLEPLTRRCYPVEGTEYGLVPVCAGVDQQGGGQTTENAYDFYRARRRANEGSRWFLTRGSGGKHTDRVWLKAPEGVSATSKIARRSRFAKRRPATDIEILNMSTDDLKDAVAAALMLDDGRNVCHLATWLATDEQHLVEFTAERPDTDGKWSKRPGMVRNEMLDIAVGCRAQNILIGGEKIDWTSPPAWAIGGPDNFYARPMGDDATDDPAADLADVPKPRRRRSGKMRVN